MSLKDILARVLRTSNPDLSDEELNQHLSSADNNENMYPIFGRLDPNNAQMGAQPEPTIGGGDTLKDEPRISAIPEGMDAGDPVSGLTPDSGSYDESNSPEKQPTLPKGDEVPGYPPAATDSLDWTGQDKPVDLNGPLPTDSAMGDDPMKAMADSGGKTFEEMQKETSTEQPPIPDASKFQWEEAPSGESPIPDASKLQWEDPNQAAPVPAAKPAPKPGVPGKGGSGAPFPQNPADVVRGAMARAPGSLSSDEARRRAVNAKLKDDTGTRIAGAAGGIGDTIENASASFGGHASGSDTQKEITDAASANNKEQKAEFENGLKNDPNSDVSRQYQVLLGKFWQKDPKELTKYSAAQISEQIPAIEKLAAIQNAKDMKMLSLEALKNQRAAINAGAADKATAARVKDYENARLKVVSNRNGGYGQQDNKVNAAIHARELLEGARNPQTGQVELNQLTSPELALTLANLVSGSNSTSLEVFNRMQPEQLKSRIAGYMGMLSSKPVNVNSPEWTRELEHILDRQGIVSEQARDNYTKGIDDMFGPQVPPSEAERIKNVNIGNSYSQRFHIDPNATLQRGNGSGAPQGGLQQKSLNGKNYVKKNGQWFEVR